MFLPYVISFCAHEPDRNGKGVQILTDAGHERSVIRKMSGLINKIKEKAGTYNDADTGAFMVQY